MAIAGGATTAYRVKLVGGKVKIERTTSLAHICASPTEALAAILDGDASTVQGSDMWAFQQAIEAKGMEIAQ